MRLLLTRFGRRQIPLAACAAATALCLITAPGATAKPGHLDPAFGVNGKVAVPLEGNSDVLTGFGYHVYVERERNGRILAAGGEQIFRYTPSGRVDRNFANDGMLSIPTVEGRSFEIEGLTLDALGRIVVVGDSRKFVTDTEPPIPAILRFGPDGTPDPSFGGGDGVVLTDFGLPKWPYGNNRSSRPYNHLTGVAVDKADRILVTGGVEASERKFGVIYQGFVARLDSTGSMDPSFGSHGSGAYMVPPAAESNIVSSADSLLVDSSEGIFYLAPSEIEFSGPPGPPAFIDRLTSAGAADVTFGKEGRTGITRGSVPNPGGLPGWRETPVQIALDSSGRILVLWQKSVQRLYANGTIDHTFGHRGTAKVQIPGESSVLAGFAVTPNDGIVAAGTEQRTSQSKRRAILVRVGPKGGFDRRVGHRGVASVPQRTASGATDTGGLRVIVDARGRAIVAGVVSGVVGSKTPSTGTGLALWCFDL